MAGRWKRGDQVVLREVWRGRVWTVRPVIVVRDAPDLIALYIAPGATWLRPYSPDGRQLRLPEDEWMLREARWDNAVLRLTRPGDAHSVLDGWDEARARFSFWYINIEEPQRRTSLGFDYMDHLLDVIVSHDLSRWRLGRVLKREPPLDEPWEDWWADPRWPVPRLPPGWEAIET